MVAFIKSMDSKAWKFMVKGWDPPINRDKDGKITNVLKAEEYWDDEYDKLSQGKSKALNTIFNGMDKNISRLINNCTIAKVKDFFSPTTKRSKMNIILSCRGIKQTLTLEKYLDLSMLHGHLQCKDFEFIEEKISQRLASWQHKLLNKAYCLTMVRYVLNSIPNYYMKVIWLPQPTCEFIDRMTRNFFGER